MTTQSIVGGLMLLFFWCLFLHSAWRFARRFAPAKPEGGVDGLLFLYAALLMTAALWFAATCAVVAPGGAAAVWPQAAKAVLTAFAGLRLLTGRVARVRVEVPVLALVATGLAFVPPFVWEEAAILGLLTVMGALMMRGAKARATYG